MRIGTDGDFARRLNLEAWASHIAVMHTAVSRMSSGSQSASQRDDQSVPAVGPAQAVRAQVLVARQDQMSVQDGLGYLQVAGANIERSQDVVSRMRAVASQAAADESLSVPLREALQKYLDRSVQELEGIAEQARYHTLKMLGGTASSWALPEAAPTQAAAVAPAVAGAATAGPQVSSAPGEPVVAEHAGVAPTAPVELTATPPTTRPDDAARTGYELRTPGAFAAPDAAPSEPRAEAAATSPAGGAFAGRTSIGTRTDAQQLVGRLDTAADLLAQVSVVVGAAEQILMRTVGDLGLSQVHLPGEGSTQATRTATVRQVEQDSVMRHLTLQSAAQTSAAVLVEATRAQFDAVTTVLGGTAAAAAAIGAQVSAPPREATMAPRPAVEPVTLTTGSSRAESGRERRDDGGAAGGGAPRR